MLKNAVSFARRYGARIAVPAAALAATAAAHAEDPASALAAVTSLSTSADGFGPVMWGLAVTGVGIMIGVKWIKRGKSAT